MDQGLRIHCALHLANGDLSVEILLGERGGQLRLALQMERGYNSELYTWEHGGYQWNGESYERVEPVWKESLRPWDAMTFWKPIEPDYRAVPGVQGDLRTQLLHLSNYPDQVQGLLLNLIDSHLDPDQISAKGRKDLTEMVKSHVKGMSVRATLDGLEVASKDEVTLAEAQQLASRIIAARSVSSNDLPLVKVILKNAPLSFGFWSAFKAALKYVDPADCPEEYGVAVTRLCFWEKSRWGQRFQDVSLLSSFGSVASQYTREYLARRARRKIVELAEENEAVFLQVATTMLKSWPQREVDDWFRKRSPGKSRPVSIPSLAIPHAYVAFGKQDYLQPGGYRARGIPDFELRSEPFSQIWESNLSLVQEIAEQSRSVVVWAWAINILKPNGLTFEIPRQRLEDLLLIDHEVLNAGAMRVIHAREDLPELSVDAWVKFFEKADHDVFDKVIQTVKENNYECLVAVAEALKTLSDPYKLSYLAWIHLLANTPLWRSREADRLAITLAIKHFKAQTEEEWYQLLHSVYVNDLIGAFEDLLASDVPRKAYEPLMSIIEKRVSWRFEVISLLSCGYEDASDLAWRTLSRLATAEDLAETLLECSEETFTLNLDSFFRNTSVEAQINALQALAASPEKSPRADLNALIAKSARSGELVWHLFASPDGESAGAAVLESTRVTSKVADFVDGAILARASEGQARLLVRVLTAHPERIASDADFGLACALCLDVPLALLALEQMQKNNQITSVWMRLVESGLPHPLAHATNYITSLKDAKFHEAVLACLDSSETVARELGLRLLNSYEDRIDFKKMWTALSESEDPIIQARLMEEALVGNIPDDAKLSDLDKRILMTRRNSRRVKEAVKGRISNADSLINDERLTALRDMAKGTNKRDREWAVQRLTQLALAGVAVPGLHVTKLEGE